MLLIVCITANQKIGRHVIVNIDPFCEIFETRHAYMRIDVIFTLPKLWSANPKGVVLFHNIVLNYTKRNVKSVVNSFFFFLGNCTDCSTDHGKCVKGFCECEDGWEGVTCEQKGESYIANSN